MKDKRKIFILDTSVLLYDKHSIHSFPGNDVIVPLVVLDELDRFKEKQGMLGENARYINRFLDDLRSEGSLHEGVCLSNEQTLRVEINHSGHVPEGLDRNCTDNKIIGVASELSNESDSKVTLITKDINFRVKCDSLGIKSEDYSKDRIVLNENQIYTGCIEISVDDELVDMFFSDGSFSTDSLDVEIKPNQFVVCKGSSKSKSCLGVYRDNKISKFSYKFGPGLSTIEAKNKEQMFALELLFRKDLPLVTMTGIAGSGKTFLTLMMGISGLGDKTYDRIVISRSLQPVGKDIGWLPGDINDKMDPWIKPIADNFRLAFGNDPTYFERFKEKGQIEVAPLSYIRGRTFNKTLLIVDEAQNSTIHELKTIITRLGEGSKIVLLGDIEQIDTPYIDTLSNGLTIVIEKFKDQELAGHITLIKGERSKIATLATRLL